MSLNLPFRGTASAYLVLVFWYHSCSSRHLVHSFFVTLHSPDTKTGKSVRRSCDSLPFRCRPGPPSFAIPTPPPPQRGPVARSCLETACFHSVYEPPPVFPHFLVFLYFTPTHFFTRSDVTSETIPLYVSLFHFAPPLRCMKLLFEFPAFFFPCPSEGRSFPSPFFP